jgi:hypothetical protein
MDDISKTRGMSRHAECQAQLLTDPHTPCVLRHGGSGRAAQAAPRKAAHAAPRKDLACFVCYVRPLRKGRRTWHTRDLAHARQARRPHLSHIHLNGKRYLGALNRKGVSTPAGRGTAAALDRVRRTRPRTAATRAPLLPLVAGSITRAYASVRAAPRARAGVQHPAPFTMRSEARHPGPPNVAQQQQRRRTARAAARAAPAPTRAPQRTWYSWSKPECVCRRRPERAAESHECRGSRS